MPRFTMVCDGHETREVRRVIRKNVDQLVDVLCPVCKHPMWRDDVAPTSRIVETLDNGLMTRRVERPAEAERLFKERSEADTKRRG